MIWTVLSVVVCLALVVKLVFFTDQVRCHSRLFYRAVLLMSAVYAFHQVLMAIYNPGREVSPITTIIHLLMFVGAFVLKPEHLPGNRTRWGDRRHDA